MPTLVFYSLLFLAVGVFFLFFHLMLGRLVRPTPTDRERLNRPDFEKDRLTVYECGEPTIGSAWVQFDLRYYVVALLFVIFDVEVAFFFPWATVFGKTNTLAREGISLEERAAITAQLAPTVLPKLPGSASAAEEAKQFVNKDIPESKRLRLAEQQRQTAGTFAWLAMIDMGIFFGVLLVGFAYLWRRGDIDWIRSTAAERLAAAQPPPATGPPAPAREAETVAS